MVHIGVSKYKVQGRRSISKERDLQSVRINGTVRKLNISIDPSSTSEGNKKVYYTFYSPKKKKFPTKFATNSLPRAVILQILASKHQDGRFSMVPFLQIVNQSLKQNRSTAIKYMMIHKT